jgi:thymidylate kinase
MKYLVIEGPDFSGKSSLIKELERRLTAANCPVELVFEPGGTQYANHLRHLMLDAEFRNSVGIEEAPCAEAELFAMLSARAARFKHQLNRTVCRSEATLQLFDQRTFAAKVWPFDNEIFHFLLR